MNILRKVILICTFFIFNANVINARITTSIATGSWGVPATWNNGVPICGDTIYISASTTVSINTQQSYYPGCTTPMFLIIEGALTFKNGIKLSLPCNSGVLVKSGGKITSSSGGGGSSNTISICGIDIWISSAGPVTTPTSYGTPISENIISVTTGNWSTASTWNCNCVPMFYHNATVDSLHTVSISSSTKINSLLIKGTLNASALTDSIHVLRNWTSSGIYIIGTSTVNFCGDKQQIIGTSSFYNLSINPISGVSINGNINLYKTLSLRSGNLNTNSALTLISNAAGTANIGTITGGNITGSIIMQRYIDAGATNWRFITAPISGATIAQLNDDFITSGFTGSDYPLWPTASNPWPSIYFYNESTIGLQDSGYVAATNTSNTINPGVGLWVWCGDTITGTQPFTIDFNGAPNKGNINLPITYTNTGSPANDGWNMVGNPYPSTIDWNSPTITKSGINNAIYIWNPNIQQFASYVGGIGINGGSRYVASSQAFWIQANSVGASVQMTEASKSNIDASFLKNSYNLPLLFNVQNSFGQDQTVVNLNSSATNDYDAMYDALKMGSTNPNLPYICSIINGNTDLSINQIPEQEIVIPIKILAGTSGIHTITISNIDEYRGINCMYLEDVFTGMIYDLFNQQTITAYIYDTTTVARYLLHIGTITNVIAVNPTCSNLLDGQIVVENNSSSGFETKWMDGQENIIATHVNSMNADSLQNIGGGVYIIETIDPSCGSRKDTISLLAPNAITANFNYANTGLDFTFNNLSANGITYLWDFGTLDTSSTINPQYTYPNDGTFLVTLTVYQNGTCNNSYSEWITIITTGVNEGTQQTPNAWISGEILKLYNPNHQFDSYRIVNNLGQQIIQKKFDQKSTSSHNLDNISSQLLFITFLNGLESMTIKIPYINGQ